MPSYSQCIGYKFGRLSFGGFNPTVEYNVKKRNWRAVHVGSATSDEEEDSDEDGGRKLKDEVDVDDEEMAQTYGSIIGTVGKQLMEDQDEDEDQSPSPAGKYKSNWNKNKRMKRGEDSDDEQNQGKPVWGKSYSVDVGVGGMKKGGGWTKKGFRSRSNSRKSPNEAQGGRGQEEQGPSNHQNQKQGDRQRNKKNKYKNDSPPEKKRKFMKPSEDY